MSGKDQAYVMEVRKQAKAILDGITWLKNQGQTVWHAEDYGNTLATGEGFNEGITAAEVGAVVFAVTDALDSTLDANGAGLKGNLARII